MRKAQSNTYRESRTDLLNVWDFRFTNCMLSIGLCALCFTLYAFECSGRLITNIEPLPGVLSALISPR